MKGIDVSFQWLSGKPGAPALPEGQAYVLGVLRAHFVQHCVAPTIVELSARLRTTNVDAVAQIVRALVRAGYVRSAKSKSIRNRNIVLVEGGKVHA